MRKINLNNEIEKIVDFIRNELNGAGFEKVIIGLSGGIDSAVTAALCVKAIGNKNVLGLMLPYRKSHPDSLNHAQEVADSLEIKSQVIDISPMVDTYFSNYANDADILRKGNRMARERMCVLYDFSAKLKALVAGTGNKSELMVGYCTQYGDSACAFEPMGHLYKTEVFKLAKILGLPASVIDKKPTADLWENQTDEDELGITYEKLDEILYHLIEKQETTLPKLGFSKQEIMFVKKLIKQSKFKRKMPPILI